MLDELVWYLAIHHDITISQSALQATLVWAGLTCKMLQKIAKEWNKASRDNFRGCIQDPDTFSGTGMEFVTVNELSKDERSLACHHGCLPIGQPAIYSHQFVCDDRYTLTAAMSTRGYIATHIVEGSMDTFNFFDFIVEDVVRPYPILIHIHQQHSDT
jgi:hypothetical protein